MDIDDAAALRSAESHDLDTLLADSPDKSNGSARMMMGQKPDPPTPDDEHDYYASEGYYNEKRVEYEPALIEQHQLNLLHNPDEEDDEDAMSVDSADIPDSLRTYVEQAEQNLRRTRADWKSPLGTLRPETPASALGHDVIPPPTEDDDDERFKEEVMAKFDRDGRDEENDDDDNDPQISYEVPALQDPPTLQKQSTYAVVKKQDPYGSDGNLTEAYSSPMHSEKPKTAASPNGRSLQPPKARKSTSPTHHPADFSPNRRDQSGMTRGVTPTTFTTASSTRNTGSSSTKTSKVKALSSSSRLLQPTASKLVQSKADHNKIGAGVDVEASRRAAQERVRERQERLRKEQASQGKKSNTTSGSDFQAARIAARERVRERQEKMRQAEQSKKVSEEKRQLSAEEGLARARARVKIRKMQEQRAKSKGKENSALNGKGVSTGLKSPRGVPKSPARPLTIPKGPKLSTSKRPRALPETIHESKVQENPKPVRRSTGPTRPVSPKFATSKRASLRNAANAMGERADDSKSVKSAKSMKSASTNSLGGSTLSSATSLRQKHVSPKSAMPKRSTTVPQAPKFALDQKYGERKRPPPETKKSEPESHRKAPRRNVTVPKAPKFALDQKYGEMKKPPPEKKNESSRVAATASMRRTVTIPEAPKFALDQKYGERKTIPKTAADEKSLAASAYTFEHHLRTQDDALTPARKSHGGVTKPVSPKFHEAHKRQLPKSSEELEIEEIERYRQNPFKARPAPKSPEAEVRPKKPKSKRPLTKPVAPKFHEMHHGKTTAERAREVLERSRRKSAVGDKKTDSTKQRQPTVPVEFHFHTASKRAPPKSLAEVDEEEMKKQFHARRMPSYNKTKSVHRKKSDSQKSPPRVIETRDPLIERVESLDSPMRQNENSSQAPDPPEMSPDRPNSEQRPGTEDFLEQSPRRVHYGQSEKSPSALKGSPPRASPKSTHSAGSRSRNASLTKVKPFSFETEARADAKKQRSAEKAREAAKEKRTVDAKKSPRETKVKPFSFQTEARAEAKKSRDAEKALQADAEVKEEVSMEQYTTPFRARPVPRSAYSKKAVPRETATSQARKSVQSKLGESLQSDSKTQTFKARTIRSSLSSPPVRQTAASLARMKKAQSESSKSDSPLAKSVKKVSTSTSPLISPRETRASLARRKQGEAARAAKPGEKPITPKTQPVVPPFKAREVPATMTSPPAFTPRDTALSNARKQQAATAKTMSPKRTLHAHSDNTAPISPSFKARKVPASVSSPPRVSPRETTTSAARKTIASLSPRKVASGNDNDDDGVTTFHARPVPDSIKSPPSMSPRETATSIARSKQILSTSPGKNLTVNVEESSFKAKPSPKYLSSPPTVSPRETALSLARRKHAESSRLEKEQKAKDEAEKEVVTEFKALPMPTKSFASTPVETRASKARRDLAESKKEEGGDENESTAFKARAVPASTYNSPNASSPRETVTSSARKKKQEEAKVSETTTASPEFKARPSPPSTFNGPSSPPRQTATSTLRQKLASHHGEEEDEETVPFKAKPPPPSTYTYDPISSFEKSLPSSSSYEKEEHGVVVLPEPHVGSLLGSQTEVEATEEENEIEFAVDESLKQAELFVQDGPEHTIDFTQPEVDEDDEDEFSVGQILGSVNDPSTNGYSNDHDLGTPRSHRSVEV